MDFRIRNTLASIDAAFLALVAEKPMAQITVRELCDQAGINRATFYRHYSSIAELMEKTEAGLLAQLGLRLEGDCRDRKEILATVVEAIESDSEKYCVLFSENGDPSFPSKVLHVAYNHSVDDLDMLYPGLSDAEKRWLFDYVANGLSAIWRDWVAGGMKQPACEVARFASRLVDSGTDGLQ